MTQATDLTGRYAGFASRAVALIIDSVIITSALTVGTWAVALTVNLMRDALDLTTYPRIEPLLAAIVLPATFILYNAAFWSLTGMTPGNAVMGVRIVRLDGSPVPFAWAVLRVLAFAVSAFLMLGFLWVLVDDRRMAWHDKIARTCVVHAPSRRLA